MDAKLKKQIQNAMSSHFVEKVSGYSRQLGYEVTECYNWKEGDSNDFYVSIKPLKDFYPDFYITTEKNEISIKMGTVSYGYLDLDEAESYLKGVDNAYTLLEILDSLDWNDCPIIGD